MPRSGRSNSSPRPEEPRIPIDAAYIDVEVVPDEWAREFFLALNLRAEAGNWKALKGFDLFRIDSPAQCTLALEFVVPDAAVGGFYRVDYDHGVVMAAQDETLQYVTTLNPDSPSVLTLRHGSPQERADKIVAWIEGLFAGWGYDLASLQSQPRPQPAPPTLLQRIRSWLHLNR